MKIQEIIDRLTAEGYTNAMYSDHKQILLPGLGEIELAYGEAKIFDAKFAWPGYGDHTCHMNIESLFEDIHETWPKEQPCETSSAVFSKSTELPQGVAETAIKDDMLVIVTEGNHDPESDEPGSM